MLLLLTVPIVIMQSNHDPSLKFGCGHHSHSDDCNALLDFAQSMDYKKWTKNTGWGDSSKSVCDWYGVSCGKDGRVVSLYLRGNGLEGNIPDSIRGLSELVNLTVRGERPTDYVGCVGSGCNFKNSTLPPGLFTLSKLQVVDFEYGCLAGTLAGFANLTNLVSMSVHSNYITGSIPQEFDRLTKMEVLKLGRNPISGELPLFKTMTKATLFACNFCALSGQFPDMFDYFPNLETSFWDGNGFTGPLPPSLSNAKKLSKLSFNINSFSGNIPAGICKIPAGEGSDTSDNTHDCRIGSDTNLTAYQADQYPWIIRVPGNNYNCSTIPSCARKGSCNKTVGVAVINPLSPVRCH